jgi:thromboxane-A synthase/cytochrome P450 family 3 subfamily A
MEVMDVMTRSVATLLAPGAGRWLPQLGAAGHVSASAAVVVGVVDDAASVSRAPTIDGPLATSRLLPWRPLIALSALLLALLFQLLLNPLERWRMRRVPGFSWRPLFGSLPLLAKMGTHDFFLEGGRRFAAPSSCSSEPPASSSSSEAATPTNLPSSTTSHPAVWKAWFGPRPWLVITDAEVARRVCGRVSARPPLSAIGPTRADRAYPGLFMARGAHFHALRRAWQPAFAPASLERYAPLMENAAEKLVVRLRQEVAASSSAPAQPTNIYQAIGDLSMAVVGSCAFGVDFATIATGGGNNRPAPAAASSSSSSEEGEDEPPSSDLLDDHHQQQQQQPSLSWRSEGRELVRAAAATFAATAGIRTSPWGVAAAVVPWAAPVLRVLADRWPDEGLARMQESREALSRAAMRLIHETRQKRASEVEEAAASLPSSLPAATSSSSRSMRTGIAPGSFLAQLMAFSDAHAGHAGSPAGSSVPSPRAFGLRRRSLSPFRRAAPFSSSPSAAAAFKATLADASLVSQAQTFMLGGFDTSTIAIAMATALLAQHPEKAARLRAEIDAADAEEGERRRRAAARGDTAPLNPSLPPPPMPYAAAVIDEALRLYPPGSILLRDPSALPADAPPLVLPLRTDGRGEADLAAGTLLVPRTARVFVNLFAIHRDPRYWPRPEEFLPERFLPVEHGGDPSGLGPSTPSAYLPFGAGARACPGAKFALREARAVLVALHRAFEFEMASDEPMRLVAGLTLSPADGVWVRLRERQRRDEREASPPRSPAAAGPPTPTLSTPTRLQ